MTENKVTPCIVGIVNRAWQNSPQRHATYEQDPSVSLNANLTSVEKQIVVLGNVGPVFRMQ